MIKSPKLLVNFLLKVSPPVIISRFIDKEIGNNRSPKPNVPPVVLNIIKLKGRKKILVRITRVDIVQFAIFTILIYYVLSACLILLQTVKDSCWQGFPLI